MDENAVRVLTVEKLQEVARVRFNRAPAIISFPPEWVGQAQPMPDFDFWCVLKGAGKLYLEGREFPLQAGATFLLRPGCHAYARHEARRPLTVFACHFDVVAKASGAVCTELMPEFVQGAQAPSLAIQRSLIELVVTRSRATGEAARASAELALWQLLLLLGEALPAGRESSATRVYQLLHEIEQNPVQPWELSAMAARAHLSPSRFIRVFGKIAGVPPARYVTLRRIALAEELLANSRASVAQVAEMVGYRDVFYFSRQFRAVKGYPPSKVRGKRG